MHEVSVKHSAARTSYQRVAVRKRVVQFALWPVQKSRGGYGQNPRLFATDPWPVMQRVVADMGAKAPRLAATAFLEQSRDFYDAAARAHTSAAKPLLLYYCFLNLAKALVLARRPLLVLDRAQHGLKERLGPSGKELADAFLVAEPSTGGLPSIFDHLLLVVRGQGLKTSLQLDLPILMRQVVTGHRLLCAAEGTVRERYLAIPTIEMHEDGVHEIWLRAAFPKSDLARLSLGQSELLRRTRLHASWRFVAEPAGSPAEHVWLEQITPIRYRHGWIADSIPVVVDGVRHHLWQTVLSTPPYRSFYVYASPTSEHGQLLPQLASSYALFFYFGSITRYRPHHFDRILQGKYAAFVESFLHEQPAQLLYLLASEFAQRDVSKPALV